jgi:DNA-binding Lrp family transcriptional regulator
MHVVPDDARSSDAIDEQILALLVEDARRSYEDIGRRVSLSSSAVKRRMDNLRASGRLRGFTAVMSYEARGWGIEAHVHIYLRPGTVLRQHFIDSLSRHPEIVEAWMMSGESDAVAHVITRDGEALERLIYELKQDGMVERTRSEIVLSQLIPRRSIPLIHDVETEEASS